MQDRITRVVELAATLKAKRLVELKSTLVRAAFDVEHLLEVATARESEKFRKEREGNHAVVEAPRTRSFRT
jgi:hypothetical protein